MLHLWNSKELPVGIKQQQQGLNFHHEEMMKLMFWAISLCQSKARTLEMPAPLSLHRGNFHQILVFLFWPKSLYYLWGMGYTYASLSQCNSPWGSWCICRRSKQIQTRERISKNTEYCNNNKNNNNNNNKFLSTSTEWLSYGDYNNLPWLKKIIWVIGVLRRTVVINWRFDNLCESHLQSRVVVLVSWKFKNPGERFDWSVDRVAVGKCVMWLAVKTRRV